jgi:hypothetical protein
VRLFENESKSYKGSKKKFFWRSGKKKGSGRVGKPRYLVLFFTIQHKPMAESENRHTSRHFFGNISKSPQNTSNMIFRVGTYLKVQCCLYYPSSKKSHANSREHTASPRFLLVDFLQQ